MERLRQEEEKRKQERRERKRQKKEETESDFNADNAEDLAALGLPAGFGGGKK